MKILDFALILGKLKRLKRTGWVRSNVPSPESVAEHSFRLAVLAMFLAPKFKADVNKCVKMALVHDIGEAETGDIVTKRGKNILTTFKDKILKERKALSKILSVIDREDFIKLFDEYEEGKTKESAY